MKEELQKEILFQTGRAAYWRNATSNPFNWDMEAMVAESEARIQAAKELLAAT
jgi:hypothetical protein